MFVTVDGLDGSGKTTLVSALAKSAKQDGCEVTVAPFPGTTDLGKNIRKFLMNPERERDVSTETLLLLANFREVYLNYRRKAPRSLLIADRFFTSTLGYQGALSDEAKQFVRRAVELAFPRPIIDVRLVLDVPYEIGQARVSSRKIKDRFDLVEREPFERIRSEIMESAARDTPKAIVLDNSGPFDRTITAAWKAVSLHPHYPGNHAC